MQSDSELMQAVCAGDHRAFAALVERHTSRYLALAYRTLHDQSDAEDIVQNAFIKLWQNPRAWNASKSQFTTWFYRVVLNACHDFRRKHGRNVLMELSTLDAILSPVASEQSQLQQRQFSDRQHALLIQAMVLLPMSQRDAINLVIYCGLSQKQAADVLGLKLKALESLLGRARRNLAKKVAEIDTQQTYNPTPKTLNA